MRIFCYFGFHNWKVLRVASLLKTWRIIFYCQRCGAKKREWVDY